jgi:hypothetical protein
VNCPPEVETHLRVERTTAFNQITAGIHREVDAFIRRTVDTDGGRFDIGRLQDGLRAILPKSDEPRVIYQGESPHGRYLIAVYSLHKGTLMGPEGTAVTARSYNAAGQSVRLAAVAGDMDGYARITVHEIRPSAANPLAPKNQKTYLLLSGYMTGANGPDNRMRLYSYDGTAFRAVWVPADVWGTFDVHVINDGFIVEGDYYRNSRKRHDEYVLSDDGVVLNR